MPPVYITPEAQFAVDGRLVVCRFVGPEVDEHILEMVRLLNHELVDSQGRAVFLVSGVNVGFPGAVARHAVHKLLSVRGSKVLGGTITIEGGGFRAAAQRAIALSVHLFVKSNYPQAIFAATTPASVWLANRIPEMTANQITASYSALLAASGAVPVSAPLRLGIAD